MGGHSSSVEENKSKVQSIPEDKINVTTTKRLQLALKVKMMCFLSGVKNHPLALDKYGIFTEPCNIAATGHHL